MNPTSRVLAEETRCDAGAAGRNLQGDAKIPAAKRRCPMPNHRENMVSVYLSFLFGFDRREKSQYVELLRWLMPILIPM